MIWSVQRFHQHIGDNRDVSTRVCCHSLHISRASASHKARQTGFKLNFCTRFYFIDKMKNNMEISQLWKHWCVDLATCCLGLIGCCIKCPQFLSSFSLFLLLVACELYTAPKISGKTALFAAFVCKHPQGLWKHIKIHTKWTQRTDRRLRPYASAYLILGINEPISSPISPQPDYHTTSRLSPSGSPIHPFPAAHSCSNSMETDTDRRQVAEEELVGKKENINLEMVRIQGWRWAAEKCFLWRMPKTGSNQRLGTTNLFHHDHKVQYEECICCYFAAIC